MCVEFPLRVVVTILECCVTFSGVKLSIRSFVLLAELIVCSTTEFTCILAEWFWNTVTSLSLLHMKVPRPHITTGPTYTG